MVCHILIPDFHMGLSEEDKESGCLLPRAHQGYHLNKLSNGSYLSWGGNGCDKMCEWCGECFNWIEISEAEANDIIAGRVPNHDD